MHSERPLNWKEYQQKEKKIEKNRNKKNNKAKNKNSEKQEMSDYETEEMELHASELQENETSDDENVEWMCLRPNQTVDFHASDNTQYRGTTVRRCIQIQLSSNSQKTFDFDKNVFDLFIVSN